MFYETRKSEPFSTFPQHVTAFTKLTDSFLSSSLLMLRDKPFLFDANDCKSCSSFLEGIRCMEEIVGMLLKKQVVQSGSQQFMKNFIRNATIKFV